MHTGPFPGLIKKIITGRIIITEIHAGPNPRNGEIIIDLTTRSDEIAVPGSLIIERYHHVLGGYGYISEKIIGIVENEQTPPGLVGGLKAFHKHRVQQFIALGIELQVDHRVNGCVLHGICLIVLQGVQVPVYRGVDREITIRVDPGIKKGIDVGIFLWVMLPENGIVLRLNGRKMHKHTNREKHKPSHTDNGCMKRYG
jgi:hypothetical protein